MEEGGGLMADEPRARALEPLKIVREPGDIVISSSGLNDFDAFGAGGKLYLAQVAKGAGGGRILVFDWPNQMPILTRSLGELGATAALLLRLARGPNGNLWALIARDTDDPSGERTWTPYDLEIALPAEGSSPTPNPAPTPGPAPDPGGYSAVAAALASLAGPEDGREAKFNSVAGVHNGVDATYDLVARRGELLEREVAGVAAAVFDVPPRQSHTDLPEYVRFGTRGQEDTAYIFTRQDFWQAAILAIREAAANLRAEGKI